MRWTASLESDLKLSGKVEDDPRDEGHGERQIALWEKTELDEEEKRK
jgi:hypothetical protein